MSCAGLSSLLLAAENLDQRIPQRLQLRLDRAIRDGFAWLVSGWSPEGNNEWRYYAYYSLQKVASIARARRFGDRDWYDLVAGGLVDAQNKDGSWPADKVDLRRIRTALSLLVLLRSENSGIQQSNGLVERSLDAKPLDVGASNWVAVPKLKRQFHIPSFFRTLRLRPLTKSSEVVRAIIDAVPAERRKALLLLPLKKAHRELSTRSGKSLEPLRQVLAQTLEQIDSVDVER